MSDENKLQTSVWLNALYTSFIQSVADTRGIEVAALKQMANEGKIQSANDALENNLVDGLLYDDQVKKLIAKKVRVN